MRSFIFWLGLIVVTASAAGLIWQKEALIAQGRTVLLELRPRDPRSLIQGDYMALHYKLAEQAEASEPQRRGELVLRLDEHQVGTFVRFHHGSALAADEQLIAYRDLDRVLIGAESYFFQEGTGDLFAKAKYGELKVGDKGECMLLGLCDEARVRLSPP
jgi:uncharacterized membrane-anchored protein